jgi:secreted protein with Ig-like and vWFA domain
MMAGAKKVRARLDGEAITRVLLLSDGLANRGVTDPWEVAGLVREARKRGVRISTLGLGLEYNEDLMQAIAESGGGHYHFVEHPNQHPATKRSPVRSESERRSRRSTPSFGPSFSIKLGKPPPRSSRR